LLPFGTRHAISSKHKPRVPHLSNRSSLVSLPALLRPARLTFADEVNTSGSRRHEQADPSNLPNRTLPTQLACPALQRAALSRAFLRCERDSGCKQARPRCNFGLVALQYSV